jgi:membrane protein required for colicin V production
MAFQILDLVLIGIMLISGLLALMRGFTRELLSLVAWGVAAVAAYFAFQQPQLIDLVQPYVDKPMIAKVIVAAVAFVVVLIIVSVIGVRISDAVVDSAVGAFDRTLGFIYGLVRGLALVAIAYLFYGWLQPLEKQEDWVKNAKSLPIIRTATGIIEGFLPAEVAEELAKNVIGNLQPVPQATDPAAPAEPADGYTDPPAPSGQ